MEALLSVWARYQKVAQVDRHVGELAQRVQDIAASLKLTVPKSMATPANGSRGWGSRGDWNTDGSDGETGGKIRARGMVSPRGLGPPRVRPFARGVGP